VGVRTDDKADKNPIMKNTKTATRPEADSQHVQLTQEDKNIILYALGTLTGAAGLDEQRKLTPLAASALRVANKIISGP
jgi:hypothetical protein